jgi:hypothetical protein
MMLWVQLSCEKCTAAQNQPTPGGAITWTCVSTHSSFWINYTHFFPWIYAWLKHSLYSHFQVPLPSYKWQYQEALKNTCSAKHYNTN